MGIYDQFLMQPAPRRSMTIFFIIDTSWSMRGAKIDAVNQAMQETIYELREMSTSNADAQIYANVLLYSTGAHWMYSRAVPVEELVWKNLTAGGQSDIKHAYHELGKSVNLTELKHGETGIFSPVYILMADGGGSSYKTILRQLWDNPLFARGIKAAIAIGDEVHENVLVDFTRCPETVIRVHNAKQLRKIIRFVSVQSSQIASRSSQTSFEDGDVSKIDQIEPKTVSFAKQVELLVPAGDDEYSDW